jgi:MoaA/NifB/PqqE/SkfB family radical SAM enzyme
MNSQPYSIGVFFLTAKCNMRCRFCITDNGLSSMRYDQALRLLDVASARGIGSLVLGGGEPFTWKPDVLRLAGVAKGRGFVLQVGTNGLHLPEGYERLDCVDRYVLPLDARDAASHNRMRVCAGSHHAIILDRLDTLRSAGKEVTVSTVLTSKNVAELPELARYLAAYVRGGGRLHAWHLYRFIPQGRGGAVNAAALDLAEDAYDAACAGVKAMDLPFTIYKRKDMRHSKTVDFFWHEGEKLCTGSEVWGGLQDRAQSASSATLAMAANCGRDSRAI